MNLLALALFSISFAAPVPERKITAEDFKTIHAAYLEHVEKAKFAPGEANDFADYIKGPKAENERLVDLLKKKDIVFLYNVPPHVMKDRERTVLSFEKAADADGRLVLFGDGAVKKLTAAEFKEATLAKPWIVARDLRDIIFGYHSYCEGEGKGPSKAEDMQRHIAFRSTEAKRLLSLLKNEDIVFIYDVPLSIAAFPFGTSNTIVAYEKNAPKDGGLVVYADCVVKTLTADQFKKAHLAEAKAKP